MEERDKYEYSAIQRGFTELWRLYKGNFRIDSSLPECDRVISEFGSVARSYAGIPVIQEFAAALLTDIERRSTKGERIEGLH